MKYLVLLLVIVVVLWLARTARPPKPRQGSNASQQPPQSTSSPAPRPIVACRHCGVHLPIDEALPGPAGHYCCEAHRQAGASTSDRAA
ncbi:PP0621 family protein [Caldimonas brevitalea]|uniref:Uncharacterized protein n=1 Tax=Caldimonas brevitalea TaxID=413882 RepID=A0A0G3BEI1_9BURK|nr:PP0621 family protein [Caldimonas brevitalea]AKJ27737.1 hypothetical protein AAW51_1046 [Caldimonas brevitalea]